MFRGMQGEMKREIPGGLSTNMKAEYLSPGVKNLNVVLPDGEMAARLLVQSSSEPGLKVGEYLALGENTVLGRSNACNLVLADPFASQEHARITFHGGQYWLEDMGSTNGTYLNEVRLERPTVLANGDMVRIGGVTFQFVRWAYEVESSN